MDAYEVARIRERLHVLDGVLRALVQRAEIDSIVWQAADAQVAHRQLMSEPLSFSEIQAHHILDMQIRRIGLSPTE